jgi:hypothetical protein
MKRKLCLLLTGLMALTFAFAQIASGAPPTTVYVTTNGSGVGYPTWADATNSIQTAIDIISNSTASTVWVSNGTYNTGGVTNGYAGDTLTNRVAITKVITVRSANNDPANTIIMGAKDPSTPEGTNGPAAIRCVYMIAGSSLIGFTLINGATLATGISNDRSGGGIWTADFPSIISNCIITGNSAASTAGGVFGGTVYNCTIVSNS